jgi:tetratricopeptide (TPR) repeat protein
MSVLAALCLALGSGCVSTPPAPVPFNELPPHAVLQKEPELPKRPPLPGTVVALARIKERDADKSKDAAEQMKLYDDARQIYQQALTVDPAYRDAIQGLARVYSHMDNYTRALEVYQKALDKNPKDHGLWYDLGMCHSRKRDLARAIPCFQKALDLEPENRQYMTKLGFTLVWVGQTDQGLAHLTHAMGTALAHYNFARVMDQQGQKEACRQHLELALQINPKLDQAREMLDGLEPTARASLRMNTQ